MKNASGPNAKLKTPVVRYVSTRPSASNANTLPNARPKMSAPTKSDPRTSDKTIVATTTAAAIQRDLLALTTTVSSIVSGRSVGSSCRRYEGHVRGLARERGRLAGRQADPLLARRHLRQRRELAVVDANGRTAVVVTVVTRVDGAVRALRFDVLPSPVDRHDHAVGVERRVGVHRVDDALLTEVRAGQLEAGDEHVRQEPTGGAQLVEREVVLLQPRHHRLFLRDRPVFVRRELRRHEVTFEVLRVGCDELRVVGVRQRLHCGRVLLHELLAENHRLLLVDAREDDLRAFRFQLT